jgi:hypothetical protein
MDEIQVKFHDGHISHMQLKDMTGVSMSKHASSNDDGHEKQHGKNLNNKIWIHPYSLNWNHS